MSASWATMARKRRGRPYPGEFVGVKTKPSVKKKRKTLQR
jgi:hypothetical protein